MTARQKARLVLICLALVCRLAWSIVLMDATLLVMFALLIAVAFWFAARVLSW